VKPNTHRRNRCDSTVELSVQTPILYLRGLFLTEGRNRWKGKRKVVEGERRAKEEVKGKEGGVREEPRTRKVVSPPRADC